MSIKVIISVVDKNSGHGNFIDNYLALLEIFPG